MGTFKGGLHDGGLLSSCGSSDMAGLLASVAPETGVGTRQNFLDLSRKCKTLHASFPEGMKPRRERVDLNTLIRYANHFERLANDDAPTPTTAEGMS